MKGIKTLLFIIVLSIICAIFVKSDCGILNNASSYYSFDSGYTDISAGSYDGTNSGCSLVSAKVSNGAKCIVGDSDYIDLNDPNWFDASTTPISFSFWVKQHSTIDYGMILDKLDVTGTVTGWSIGYTGTTLKLGFAFYDTTAKVLNCRADTAITLNTWEYWTITYDGNRADCTHFKFYQNGVLKTTVSNSDTDPSTDVNTAYDANFNRRSDGAGYINNMTIDEFGVYSGVLTQAQINNLYNAGVGCNPYTSVPVPSLTLNKKFPTINNYQSSSLINFAFNGTILNTDYDNFLCKIFINNTNFKNISPSNIRQTQYFNYTLDFKKNTFKVNCTNTNSSSLITWLNITQDRIEPFIRINYPTENLQLDYTIDFEHNITFNDSNLDGFNVTYFLNKTTPIKKQVFLQSGITTPIYNLINTTNSSLWCTVSPCSMYVKVIAWDSHNPINNIVKVLDSKIYSTYIDTKEDLIIYGNNVKFGYNNKDKPYTFFYLSDNKYKLKVTFSDSSLYHTFYINTTDWYYLPYSKYKGHFINRNRMRYFDNIGKNIKNVIVIKTLKGYRIEVEHYIITDEVEFESIGDLNINTKYIHFTLYELPDLNTQLLIDINSSNTNIANYANSINTNVSNIWSEIKMIGLILIFLVLLYLGLVKNITVFLFIDSFLLFYIGFNLYNSETGLYKVFILILSITSFLFLLFYSSIKLFQKYAFKKEETKYNKYKDSFK